MKQEEALKQGAIEKQATPVYGVVDKDNAILTEQLPFYFRKDYAQAAAQQMNRSVVEKNKPYRVKKGYLIYPD